MKPSGPGLLFAGRFFTHNQSLPTLLLCALTYTSDFTGGCPPPPLSEKGGTGDLSSEQCLLVASILQGLTLHDQGLVPQLGGTTRGGSHAGTGSCCHLSPSPCPGVSAPLPLRLSSPCMAGSGGSAVSSYPPSPHACASSWSCSRILPPLGMSHHGQAAPLTEVVSSHPSFQG